MMSLKIKEINTKIYADGASIDEFLELNKYEYIKGFTTNPTLMRANGVNDYKKFAKELTNKIKDKPISFEVFDDEIKLMKDQALEINSWAKNIFVKIPITNTKGLHTSNLIKELNDLDIRCNVTAIFKIEQCLKIIENHDDKREIILSIFAGRIADTGVDPVPIIKELKNLCSHKKTIKILWASPREVLNIVHANQINCDIITVTKTILDKLKLFNKNLDEYSLETVKMFYNDAQKSGFKI